MTNTPHHILVAENNRSMAAVLQFNLAAAGFRVTLAQNGRQALELAQENDFDLVLTDYGMPEMVGAELLRHLRRDDRYVKTPLILMSAFCNDLDLRRLKDELSLAAIFAKPFGIAELVGTITAHLAPNAGLPLTATMHAAEMGPAMQAGEEVPPK